MSATRDRHLHAVPPGLPGNVTPLPQRGDGSEGLAALDDAMVLSAERRRAHRLVTAAMRRAGRRAGLVRRWRLRRAARLVGWAMHADRYG